MKIDSNAAIDESNRVFWDELCGSQLAKQLGVTDSSPESLKRFDDWYFEFYPYLLKHIPFETMQGRDVLEVGLGYGTVAQRLAESGASYHGLDIAAGPVNMVNQRLLQCGLSGEATQGSVLEAPFENESMDWVVAIGCFHHTGNVSRAIDEAWRMLRNGGQAMVMMYSAYSYRRWIYNFYPTMRYFLWDKLGIGKLPESDERERRQYDTSADGVGAPSTEFLSSSHVKRLTEKWTSVECVTENIGEEFPFARITRETANARFGSWVGLDLYCHLKK